MRYFGFIICFLFLIISVLQGWMFASVAISLLLSWYFGALILVVLAFILDGYYGAFYGWPMLSIVSIIWFVFLETSREYITLSDEN